MRNKKAAAQETSESGEAPDGMPGGGFGGSGEVTNGTAANTITEDSTVSTQTYTSDGDFYGQNAALLALN